MVTLCGLSDRHVIASIFCLVLGTRLGGMFYDVPCQLLRGYSTSAWVVDHGWFLLHHLLGINLPFESSSDVVVSYDQPFDMPPSTALFWTEWSEWPACPSSEPCHVDKAHKSPIHMMKRTRLCQRQSVSDLTQTKSVPNPLTWMQASQAHTPCLIENARETQVKFCEPTETCTDDATTEMPHDSAFVINQTDPILGHKSLSNEFTLTLPENLITDPTNDDELWSPWQLVVACRPLILELDELSDGFAWDHLLRDSNQPKRKRCEPGIEIYRRDCQPQLRQIGRCGDKPGNGQQVNSYQLRHAHCWINERCPGGNQTIHGPMACDFRTFLTEPRLRVSWYRTPYGLSPTHYQVRIMPIDMLPGVQIHRSEIKEVPLRPSDPWGEAYSTDLEELELGQAYEVIVSAVDAGQTLHTSKTCQAALIIGAAV
ncbi:unnamed protein product [Echinostoma caproni]|uniref:Fibronectin type-III domain-containing protein n=1 Tax=Echinostoma caproni TaxID=27848 RepID=A0A183ACJ2_9TREM|nr:unnamed protein product [Echinostoma caproni]